MLKWLKKFRYEIVHTTIIAWSDDGQEYDWVTLFFKVNSFGKRHVTFTRPRYRKSVHCGVKDHPFWHHFVIPWITRTQDFSPKSEPPKKDNVVRLVK